MYSPFSSRKGAVFQAKADRATRKENRRAQRLEAKAERIARGETGAPIDWGAAVTSVSDTPYEGVARTLSRGL
jgi:hypothetical protein